MLFLDYQFEQTLLGPGLPILSSGSTVTFTDPIAGAVFIAPGYVLDAYHRVLYRVCFTIAEPTLSAVGRIESVC